MKRFSSLEEQEHNIKSEEVSLSSKKKNIPFLPIIISIVALIIVIVLCIRLFSPSKSNSESTSAKAYEIEVDGKKYSANTIEELNEMVGFDVTYLFNNPKEKSTKVEAKLYENGELANIKTEYGTYKFGVTDAILLKRAPTQGGETMYQITYVVENVNFDSGDGSGVSLFPENLTVTDSDGNECSTFNSYFNDEMINAYDSTAPGKRTEKKVIYQTNNQNCTYLDVYFDSRGVTCKINITNLDEFCNENKIQQVDIGTAFTVSNTFGKVILTVDDAKIDNSFLSTPSSDSDIFIVDLDIDNVNYDAYDSGSGIDGCFALSKMIDVKDNNNYTVSLANHFSNSADGKYAFYGSIKPGAKGRLALPYEIDKNTKYITLDFGNGTTLKIDFKN